MSYKAIFKMKHLKDFLPLGLLLAVFTFTAFKTGLPEKVAPALFEKVWVDPTLTGEGHEASPLGINRGTELSPAQLTGNVTDYDPTGWDAASTVFIDSDSKINGINGFAAPDASTSPQRKGLFNVGDYPFYIAGTLSGTAAYRVITPGDHMVKPGESVELVYDNTAARWRLLGRANPHAGKTQFFFSNAASVTAGDWPDLSFTSAGTSSGVTISAASTTVPSSFALATGTQSSGFAGIYHSKSITHWAAFGIGHITASGVFYLPTLSDGTDTYTAVVQISNQNGTASASTLAANNTVGIRYTHGTNSGKLQGYSVDNAGGVSTTDLGVTVLANTLYDCTVSIDKSRTEVRFYVNGDPVGVPITSNLPSNVTCMTRTGIVKTVGTASRILNVPKFWSSIVLP